MREAADGNSFEFARAMFRFSIIRAYRLSWLLWRLLHLNPLTQDYIYTSG